MKLAPQLFIMGMVLAIFLLVLFAPVVGGILAFVCLCILAWVRAPEQGWLSALRYFLSGLFFGWLPRDTPKATELILRQAQDDGLGKKALTKNPTRPKTASGSA
jgi:phosphate/sulfate permease